MYLISTVEGFTSFRLIQKYVGTKIDKLKIYKYGYLQDPWNQHVLGVCREKESSAFHCNVTTPLWGWDEREIGFVVKLLCEAFSMVFGKLQPLRLVYLTSICECCSRFAIRGSNQDEPQSKKGIGIAHFVAISHSRNYSENVLLVNKTLRLVYTGPFRAADVG